jgi:hypothetical protein
MSETQEKIGIQETKEMIVAILKISPLLIKTFKKGLSVSSAAELWAALQNDPVIGASIIAAYKDYEKIPAEVKDLDAYEGIEIGGVLLAAAPEIIKALKE